MSTVLKGNLLKYIVTRIDYEDLYEIEKDKFKQIREFCRQNGLTFELTRDLDIEEDFELNDPLVLREISEEYIRTCVCNCYFNDDIKVEINQFFIRVIQKVNKDDYTTYLECHLPLVKKMFEILDIDNSLIVRISIKKIDETFFESLESMKEIFKPELVQCNIFGSNQKWNRPSSGSVTVQNFEYKNQLINFFRKIDRVVFRQKVENKINDNPYYRIYIEYEVYRIDYNSGESLQDNLTDIDSVTMDLFLESFTDEGRKKISNGEDVGYNGFNA